jgi:hypothetical protein
VEDAPGRHWDAAYAARSSDEQSWFEASPTVSLELLARHGDPRAPLIDVGAGASTLARRLIADGWRDVTVLDVAATALHAAGDAPGITAVHADVTRWRPQRRYATWHDRAAFHFLVDEVDRAAYVEVARAALVPGGILVVGTFAEDGPPQCSGLPVARYGPEELATVLGADTVLESRRAVHLTPDGRTQPFTWVVARLDDPSST